MAALCVFGAMQANLPTLSNVCSLHVGLWDYLIVWAKGTATQYAPAGALNTAMLKTAGVGIGALPWEACLSAWQQQKVGVYPVMLVQGFVSLLWIGKGAWVHLIKMINTQTPMYVFQQKLRMFGLSAQVFFFTLVQLLACGYAYAKVVLGVVSSGAIKGAAGAIVSLMLNYPLPLLVCIGLWWMQWVLLRWYKRSAYWDIPYRNMR